MMYIKTDDLSRKGFKQEYKGLALWRWSYTFDNKELVLLMCDDLLLDQQFNGKNIGELELKDILNNLF